MMKFEKQDNWIDTPGYDQKVIAWSAMDDGDRVLKSVVDGQSWILRLNDFPDEPLFTLLVDEKEIIHFTQWPKNWVRPR
ncbi:hypothetical protein CH75_05720 [Dyella jiangningensis]|nr:hypothetical protein CH75_05720 [Dyella jiangningensis]